MPMPIYLALLFKVMKERGVHEGCIEQVDGLFRDSLYGSDPYLDEEADEMRLTVRVPSPWLP